MLFSEGMAAAGLAVLTYLLIPKRFVPKWKPFNCGICLSAWYGISIAFYQGQTALHIIQVAGCAAVFGLLIVTWAPWVWSTTEEVPPALPEEP